MNNNEKKIVEIIENAKRYVKGELELDCFDGIWTAMDYREDLEGAFYIDAKGFDDKIISVSEAKKSGVDVRKCCDICGISYVG